MSITEKIYRIAWINDTLKSRKESQKNRKCMPHNQTSKMERMR